MPDEISYPLSAQSLPVPLYVVLEGRIVFANAAGVCMVRALSSDQLLGELDVPMGKASQRRVRRLFGGRAVKDWAKLQQQSAYKQALRTLREAKLIK